MPAVDHPPIRLVRELVHQNLLQGPRTVVELHTALPVVPRHDRYLIRAALRTLERRDLARSLTLPSSRTKLWLLTEAGYGAPREAVA